MTRGKRERHVASPRMTGDNRASQFHDIEKSEQIIAHRGEIVTGVRLGALAVPALLEGKYMEIALKQRRDKVKDVHLRCQAVQKYHRHAARAPFAIMEFQASQFDEFVNHSSFVRGLSASAGKPRTLRLIIPGRPGQLLRALFRLPFGGDSLYQARICQGNQVLHAQLDIHSAYARADVNLFELTGARIKKDPEPLI